MSCDTFVALPPYTDGCIIFGKNSDRPASEVQEVVFHAAKDHVEGTELECTYIKIAQTSHTYAVILSKPAWMWGAEMGANEHAVCIGNEAVWTKAGGPEDQEERLLGMDLVRLGLERGRSAKDALDTMTGLLAQHGQGGPCYDDPAKAGVTYHNSFIIADGREAWVLETAGKMWAAEKVTSGVRNLSNLLTIGTKIDCQSDGLTQQAVAMGLHQEGQGSLDFTKAFAASPPSGIVWPENERPENRFAAGKRLMEGFPTGGFHVSSMMSVLRDQEAGICRLGQTGGAVTVASQISVIYPPGSGVPSCHWFTATPNPRRSVFKPFFFTDGCGSITPLTASPGVAAGEEDPARVKPRFASPVDRKHALYAAHERLAPLAAQVPDVELLNTLMDLETQCVGDVTAFLENFDKSREEELAGLYTDIVESEVKFYSK